MKTLRWAVWLAIPFLLCIGWIAVQSVYEVWELRQVARVIDEAELPGIVIARDGRNDWPFGTSNGALIRMNWLVESDRPQELRTYMDRQVAKMQPKFENLRYSLRDAGPLETWEQESSTLEGETSLFVLRISNGRGQYMWEIPD